MLLGALALVLSVVLPALGSTRQRMDRATCLNNLRQIGQGLQSWASEHQNILPWRLPSVRNAAGQYDTAAGGTTTHPLARNIFLQFSWISNELRTPKILACPSDQRHKPAFDFGGAGTDGLLNPVNQNNAISYFAGLDVFYDARRGVLSGDHNLRTSGLSSCSSGITPVPGIRTNPAETAWTNALHGFSGNLLLSDGHVREVGQSELNDVFDRGLISDGTSVQHILTP